MISISLYVDNSHNLQNPRGVDLIAMDYSKRPKSSSDFSSDDEKKLGTRKRTKIIKAFKRPKP